MTDTEPEPQTSSFERFAEVVYLELNKFRTTAGRSQLPDDQTDTGRNALRAQRPAPWIVMLKRAGTITEPEDNRRTDKSGKVYSILHRAEQTVEAHIMGSDDNEAEKLWCDFLIALRRAVGPFANPGNFEWASQEDENAGHSRGGREKIVQSFTLTMDVPDEMETLTIITAEQLTQTLEANC